MPATPESGCLFIPTGIAVVVAVKAGRGEGEAYHLNSPEVFLGGIPVGGILPVPEEMYRLRAAPGSLSETG